MFSQEEKNNNLSYQELHIRHLNLLIDLKNYQFNNWFYKMAIINTFDDIKIFLSNLEKNKYKCIIAIKEKKIIGYVYTFPINNKKTCLKINSPKIITDNIYVSKRDLIFNLIKTAINNNSNTSNWIISADINNTELISCSRELGFQPLQEIILWKKGELTNNSKNIDIRKFKNYEKINKSNIKRVLNFIRSNESTIIRNLLDLELQDIINRSNNKCGIIINNQEIFFSILKDLSFENDNIYFLIRSILSDYDLNNILKPLIQSLMDKNNDVILKTYSHDNLLNKYLSNLKLTEINREIIMVRNTLIKRDIKSENKLNMSWKKLFENINPQGDAYPSPSPIKLK